jgi:lauroyl/myristoyl acyltransferase
LHHIKTAFLEEKQIHSLFLSLSLMKRKIIIRHRIEKAAFIAGKVAVRCLSRRAVLRLSRLIGFGVYTFSPLRRKFAEANLNLAFGDSLSPKEKRAINIKSFQSFSQVFIDLFWFDGRSDECLNRYLKYDESFNSIFDGNPNIILTAHFGNWELVGVACGRKGYPLTSVALEGQNPILEHALNSLRTKSGSEIVAREGAIRKIIKSLRDGRSTAFLIDHNTLPDEGGVFVPFFGLPVPVSNAAPALQARTDAKLVVTWCLPDDNGGYTVYSKPPLQIEKSASKQEITAELTKGLEDVIRKHPQYWLWCYRRWRFFRAGDPAEKYPFYAESYEENLEFRNLIKNHRKAISNEEEARRKLSAAATARREKLQHRKKELMP